MQNTKENQATIGNLIDELIDSVIDDNTHDNCVQRQIDKLKQVIFSGGWISVDDELPEPDKMVIIAVDLGLDTPKICLGSYAKDDTPITDDEGNTYSYSHWWNDENDDFMWEFGEVKYWQPLPELPQKKTKRTLVLALLADNHPFVLVHKETNTLHLCDESTIDEFNLDDYFIDCKMTGQTIIDYVDGKVIFEPPQETKRG